MGPWTLWLGIDKEGRYPAIENVIPFTSPDGTNLRIDAEDAAFLARTLSRLPGADVDNAPITLDLNGHVSVRARGANDTHTTEVILTLSETSGKAVRYAGNRRYLARALDLGFREAHVISAGSPVLFSDERRKFLWMGFGSKDALVPQEDDIRMPLMGSLLQSFRSSTAGRARRSRLHGSRRLAGPKLRLSMIFELH